MTKRRRDEGFAPIELLLVIVILGVLATIVVAAVRGAGAEAQTTSCHAHARLLGTAADAFFAKSGTTVIVPLDATTDGYENRLVNEGFLRDASSYYDLGPAGELQLAAGSACVP